MSEKVLPSGISTLSMAYEKKDMFSAFAELLPKEISNKFTLAYVQLKVNLTIK